MKPLPPDFPSKSSTVFVDHPGVTLQDVRNGAAQEPAGTARRDRLSAIDAISRLCNRRLDTIQASRPALQALFMGRIGPELGVSRKTFQNIRSALFKAVDAYGLPTPRLTARIPLSDVWKDLLAKIEEPDYASGLRRLGCFCSATGVAPDRVGKDVLLKFHEALVTEGIVKRPRITLYLTITYWNMQAKIVKDWPAVRLSSPFPSNAYILPLNTFPKSFQTDLTSWERKHLEPSLVDDDSPDQAARPATVRYQGTMLRRLASILALAGISTQQISSLSVLVEPENVRKVIRWFEERHGSTPTGQLRNIRALVLAVAEHHVKAPQETLTELMWVTRKLKRKKRKGLTKRNVKKLEQFNDPEKRTAFLSFPFDYIKTVPADISPHRQAKYYEKAAAAGIFIYGHLRVQNVRTIKVKDNLRWVDGKAILTFDGSEMKSHRSFEVELPSKVSKILEIYLKKYRKLLPGSEGPYLFPARDGGPRPASTISNDFKTTIRRQLGLDVNAHLVRHVAGKFVADNDPSKILALSQKLDHARPETTLDAYMPNGSLSASRIMNSLLEESLKGAPSRKSRFKRQKK